MDQQNFQAPNPNPNLPQNTGKGASIASLVLGIVGIALFWYPVWNTVALAAAIIGLVLAVVGRKKSAAAIGKASGLATAGLVLSIIGTVFAAIGFFSCTVCVLCAAGCASAL